MTNEDRLPPALAQELKALNRRQRVAVEHLGCVVVRAGPGSGKTRTLVTKVAWLVAAVVSPHQGVAALTYTNQAAGELARRLARLGLHPGRRLASRTVHSWCLTAILRPYARLTGVPLPHAGDVIDDRTARSLLGECFDQVGAFDRNPDWDQPLVTKIRRTIGAGHATDGFDQRLVRTARLFDQRLIERDLIDYDAMVARALQLLRANPPVLDLVAARSPWIVVDEYQDLGPVLHKLVLVLRDRASVEVCAVGDPDQSVMGFTGADPRYLNELADRDDFLDIGLDLNYRCGSVIIAASHAALGDVRNHYADPDRSDKGVVEPIVVSGGLSDHANVTVERICQLTDAGVSPDQIAVLYPRKGPLLDAVEHGLGEADIDYIHERDQRLPTGGLVDFLRGCGARRIAGPQPCGHATATNPDARPPTLPELVQDYQRLRTAARLPSRSAFDVARRLQPVLDAAPADHAGTEPVGAFIKTLDDALDLTELAAASPEQRGHTALAELTEVDETTGLSLEQFTGPKLAAGKVTLTTYHSAKGCEYSVVILPGLVEGIVPRLSWSRRRRRYEEPARAVIAEQRRTYYVALTRAAHSVILIYGPLWESSWGHRNELGPSRFVIDIIDRLNSTPHQ